MKVTSKKGDKMNDSVKTSVDIEGEGIHWKQDISYAGYLDLDALLDCQTPRTDHHDEMLFIVIHQATEVWLKCCLHELGAAMEHIKRDELGPVFKMLSRVSKIQANLKQSWDILATLTPADYAAFRDGLGQSSGFQSYQYREVEYWLGNKNAKMADAHKGKPARFDRLQDVLDQPSIYDLCLQLLKKRGLEIPAAALDRTWREPYSPSEGVEAAWVEVYKNTDKHWDLYELAEKLVDLEHEFHAWRFAHMKTVERIIGDKMGTGGTSGVSYLIKALDLRFFPELWTARTKI